MTISALLLALLVLAVLAFLAGLGVTDVITLAWTRGGATLSSNVTLTSESGQVLDVPVPGPSTDLHVNVAIDFSQVTALYLVCDGALTIETNSSSAPDDTITLAANKPLVWYTGCGTTNPLTADVTALYLTTASQVALTFQARILSDATP